VSLTNHVVDLVSREEIYWWEPPDPDDEEECAEFTAFALATLRWIHQERAGRAPVPCYTRAKATAWVARRQQPVQLCLWNGMT
jgi:hypothetical protein